MIALATCVVVPLGNTTGESIPVIRANDAEHWGVVGPLRLERTSEGRASQAFSVEMRLLVFAKNATRLKIRFTSKIKHILPLRRRLRIAPVDPSSPSGRWLDRHEPQQLPLHSSSSKTKLETRFESP